MATSMALVVRYGNESRELSAPNPRPNVRGTPWRFKSSHPHWTDGVWVVQNAETDYARRAVPAALSFVVAPHTTCSRPSEGRAHARQRTRRCPPAGKASAPATSERGAVRRAPQLE